MAEPAAVAARCALGRAIPDRAARAPEVAEDEDAANEEAHWQRQIEVPRRSIGSEDSDGEQDITLLARGSHLPTAGGIGYVVVFDDITQVISAQRAVAWGEVARRLAHEIKNPLTPIQLAAERLQMKLVDKLPGGEADVLRRGTTTIVNQVAAMKRMVDDFRDYARVPPARLVPLNLNALIEEVVTLYRTAGAPVTLSLAHLPLIEGDATQLRQVIHNLIGNAQEALAGHADARIVVRTALAEIVDASSIVRGVRLSVEDNGPGFAANILRRAFEPYITTKPSGTGLGLAMVKKVVDEHGAHVEAVNRGSGVGHADGAIVTIVFRRLAHGDAAQGATRRVEREPVRDTPAGEQVVARRAKRRPEFADPFEPAEPDFVTRHLGGPATTLARRPQRDPHRVVTTEVGVEREVGRTVLDRNTSDRPARGQRGDAGH